MHRISVVGAPGSGKTTLGGCLSERLASPLIELDALFWDGGWTPALDAIFRDRVQQAIDGERWIASGNYSRVRDLVWSRADTLVWLDYPLQVCLRRLLRRTWQRIATRQELWGGNRESMRRAFFSHDSLLWYAIRTHCSRRRRLEALLGLPEYQHLTVARFRAPSETEAWLSGL